MRQSPPGFLLLAGLAFAASSCGSGSSDESTVPTRPAQFEGNVRIDGEPVEETPVPVYGEVQHYLPSEDGCSEVWWLNLGLGTGVTATSAYVNLYALVEFEEGQEVQLHQPSPGLGGGWTSPLVISYRQGPAAETDYALSGGRATIQTWSRELIQLRIEGGEWCEREGDVGDWSCSANPHVIEVERFLAQDGPHDFVWEDAICHPVAEPVNDWMLVEGTGTLCTIAEGSCPDE